MEIRFHKRQVSFLVIKTVTYKRGIKSSSPLVRKMSALEIPSP